MDHTAFFQRSKWETYGSLFYLRLCRLMSQRISICCGLGHSWVSQGEDTRVLPESTNRESKKGQLWWHHRRPNVWGSRSWCQEGVIANCFFHLSWKQPADWLSIFLGVAGWQKIKDSPRVSGISWQACCLNGITRGKKGGSLLFLQRSSRLHLHLGHHCPASSTDHSPSRPDPLVSWYRLTQHSTVSSRPSTSVWNLRLSRAQRVRLYPFIPDSAGSHYVLTL